MIDALASQPQYAAHVRPVFDALPDRGTFHTGARLLPPGAPTLVASYIDMRYAMRRPVIYLEHGSGQTYRPGHSSYAGGRGKDAVGLFLSPNERVAAINRAAYPKADHAVIGCPMLDKWVGYRPANPEPVVAFAWHWNGASVAPEARSAFPHYAKAIPALPFRLLGHGHPRAMRQLGPFYAANGIEATPDFDEVLRRADLLVADNTSATFLFARLGRPVLLLNCPWYRRDVHWGLRFWDAATVGVQCDEPGDLAGAIAEALADRPAQRAERERIVSAIYPFNDGRDTERAVAAISAMFSQAVAA